MSTRYYGMPVRSFEALCRVNLVKLGTVYSTLDDLYGALGVANLKVGVIGTATRERTRRVFRASHLGFYIHDHYDFNGFQYLGTWTKDHVLTKAEAIFGETYTGRRILDHRTGAFAKVFNSDLRDYRDRTGRGGDFVVFSDALWQQCDAVAHQGQRPMSPLRVRMRLSGASLIAVVALLRVPLGFCQQSLVNANIREPVRITFPSPGSIVQFLNLGAIDDQTAIQVYAIAPHGTLARRLRSEDAQASRTSASSAGDANLSVGIGSW